MDIQLLSKMIGELVLTSDEVGLPGLGTFVAGVVPASFSDRGFTINPPYRRLSFLPGNPSDSRLAELYASGNGIGADDAGKIILSFVEELKGELEAARSVIFPGLGKMKATKDGGLLFVSDADLDIFPEGFGLEPVSLRSRDYSSGDIFDEVTLLPETPELADEPAAEPAVDLVAEPVEEPAVEAPAPEPVPVPVPKKKHTALWIVLAVVIAAAVAMAAFLILAKTAPDFIDSLLYTQEELEILKW